MNAKMVFIVMFRSPTEVYPTKMTCTSESPGNVKKFLERVLNSLIARITYFISLLQNITGVRVQRNKLVGIFNADRSPAGVSTVIGLHPLQRRRKRKRFSTQLRKINTG